MLATGDALGKGADGLGLNERQVAVEDHDGALADAGSLDGHASGVGGAQALGLLDAWANAPDEQSPADERICQLACLLADYHGLPEGRIRDETFAEATLINVWLHRADCISSPTETYDEIIAFAAGIHVE